MEALDHDYLMRRGTAEPSPIGPGLVITIIFYFVTALLIQYVYGQIFTTLATVENPNPNIYMEVAAENSINEGPITSSPGSTIRHLQANGGRLSFLRGFGLYMLINVAGALILLPFSIFGPRGYLFGSLIVMPIVSNLQVGWVHVVISKPSTKSTWSRIPPFRRTWSRISWAVILRSFAVQVVAWIIAPIASSMNNELIPNRENIYKYVFLRIGILSLALILYVLIQMPAEATFNRVAASMLPDDDEAIVPFDRSFGCRVTPAVIGGSGNIGVLDAWRSFNRESQMLVIKAVSWNFGLQIALLFAFGIVFVLGALLM